MSHILFEVAVEIVPASLVSGFGSGRVLPGVKNSCRVGSGKDRFGSGFRVPDQPLIHISASKVSLLF